MLIGEAVLGRAGCAFRPMLGILALTSASLPPVSAEPDSRLVLNDVPPLRREYVDISRQEHDLRLKSEIGFRSLRSEQRKGIWHAFLVPAAPEAAFTIRERFSSPEDLQAFLETRNAVTEVWSLRDGGLTHRRIKAGELSSLDAVQPSVLAVTYLDPQTNRLRRERLAFGSSAASEMAHRSARYHHHRQIQNEMRRIMRTRAALGGLSASAQWNALRAAAHSGRLPLRFLPIRPPQEDDFFVAMECELDAAGQIVQVVRAYRASEVSARFVDGREELVLQRAGDTRKLTARSVEARGSKNSSIRIYDAQEPDPHKWNLLEFGEAEVLRQTSLAHLGLINAHLEHQRKELAWKKSNLDQLANPVFTGLNVTGGLTGVGAPLGEIARLIYNLTVGPRFTPDVPTPRELEDLFRYLAAKARHPELARKPGPQLDARELRTLQRAGALMSEGDVADAVRGLSDQDLQAMLQFPRVQNMDQKYRLVVDLLSDLGKATEASESGVLKTLFNNSTLAPNGDLSLSTGLALAVGQQSITPLSGVSLQELAEGGGSAEAWLQFLNLTVDLRSIVNTLTLLRNREQRDRELRRPFPHAPRINDLAAYEMRLFGYPLLFRYKRGLLKNDLAAYRQDFAYGIVGAEIVEHFSSQEDFLKEYRAGRLAPLGYVNLPGGPRGTKRQSNLPVFGHRIPSGPHAGKTSLIVYGLKAYREHLGLMQRELKNFRLFERVLEEGGVIRSLIKTTKNEHLPPRSFEPVIHVGEDAASIHFSPLLQDLLEHQRLVRFREWGIELDRESINEQARLQRRLKGHGIHISTRNPDPLLSVDATFSVFTFRTRIDGRWQSVQITNLASMAELARAQR